MSVRPTVTESGIQPVSWSDKPAEQLMVRDDHQQNWQDFAACRGRGSLFFASKSERPQARARREATANRICEACPVLIECRSWAREHCEYGFWGGESEEERYLLGFRMSAPIGIRTRLKPEAEPHRISA